MAKAKVTPTARTPQPAPRSDAAEPRTIPLSDITITWPPLRDFEGEPEKPITLSGKRLGAIVAWMARTTPGAMGPGEVWDHTKIWLDLRGLGEILRGLSTADLEMIPANTPAILSLLATMADDMAGRLAAADDVETDFKDATVTIGAPATEAQ